jgi:hypothetical protein
MMSMSTFDGRLWGDFIAIFWISQYLQCSIHIWNKISGQIMLKIENNSDNQTLNIIHGSNHFELVHFFI